MTPENVIFFMALILKLNKYFLKNNAGTLYYTICFGKESYTTLSVNGKNV